MLEVILKKGEEEAILNGFSWIYNNEILSFNGPIKSGEICKVKSFDNKFVGYGFFNSASKLMVRMLTLKDETIDYNFFYKRIKEAIALRETLAFKNATRLIFSEADFLPGLVVDKYNDILVCQFSVLGMYLLKDMIKDILVSIIKPRGIYYRNDLKVNEIEGIPLEKVYLYNEFPTKLLIEENGLKLYVDIKDGQKTGYFLDQKLNRDYLKYYVKDKVVLDCFSHTGGFSLNALKNGCKKVVACDISEHATNFIKEKTNGLLSPDLQLSSETFFVLLNTLYLKDVWNILGRDLALYNGDIDFTNSDGSVALNKDFLLGNYETGLTYENDDFESFYAETLNGYELIFIKPKGDKRVEDVFIQENIEYLMDHDFSLGALDNENLLEHKTRVIFPEFEAEFFKEIKDTLITDFGITDLFNYKCDLTPLIKTDVPHWCTDLIHATKLKVDRKGIEGAAISALVDAGAAYDPYEKVFHDFVVDRSFGYLIRSGHDKILFSGVIETL